MTHPGTVATSSVVLSNVAYVAGAVVVMIVITTILVLRQRKPRSMEANVESFNRGLRALAPSEPPARRRPPPAQPDRAASVQFMTGPGRAPAESDPG